LYVRSIEGRDSSFLVQMRKRQFLLKTIDL
jgi:hypothetical protein